MSETGFYAELRALRVERLLDASVEIITEEGWERLTMTKVAQRAGIPRQSVHKEVGTRSELGEAVVRREMERFLTGVRGAVEAHPGDPVEGLGAAARFALEHGTANVLLKAILRPGRDPELLELLTVRSEAVLAQATQTVHDAVRDTIGAASEEAADTMVRLTMSHLLQPSVSIDVAVARIMRTMPHLDQASDRARSASG